MFCQQVFIVNKDIFAAEEEEPSVVARGGRPSTDAICCQDSIFSYLARSGGVPKLFRVRGRGISLFCVLPKRAFWPYPHSEGRPFSAGTLFSGRRGDGLACSFPDRGFVIGGKSQKLLDQSRWPVDDNSLHLCGRSEAEVQ